MFITFEGGEGSGKTSVIKAISKLLTEQNIPHITTREPGGSLIAEKIRNILLDKSHTQISGNTEALLFAAARIQHLEEVILPALNENKIVLCDRFIDSSLAYQGYARGLGIDVALKINHFAEKHLPNYTIYIDVDPELGIKRATKRGDLNRLDLETIDFHKKVREGYLILADMYKDRFIVIDGNCNLETLIERTVNELKAVLL